MRAITNVNLVLADSILPGAVLLTDGGRIVDLGPEGKLTVPEGAGIFDGKGLFLGPGLIDIHTHAAGGVWIWQEPEAAADTLLRHGVTSVLPALYISMDAREQIEALNRLRTASRKGAGRIIRGAYMESTYLNPKFGCDLESNRWAGPIRREDYLPLIEAAGDFARVWCLAPEREGIPAFVRDLKDRIPAVVLSVAHSEATPQEVERYIPDGLRLATHHTNATGTLDKYPECRGVCVDEAVNYNDDIYAELICDSMGIHVDPYMLRLVVKIKGKDRVILVSDACVFDGPVPEGYDGATDINFDFEGQIAGSKLTLDTACRNMMKHTGCGLADVFLYASRNPARLLSMRDRGELGRGKTADLILVDQQMNVKQVFLEGEPVLNF